MSKKLLYEAPEAQILVVQAEAMICASGEIGIEGFGSDPGEIDFNAMFDMGGLL